MLAVGKMDHTNNNQKVKEGLNPNTLKSTIINRLKIYTHVYQDIEDLQASYLDCVLNVDATKNINNKKPIDKFLAKCKNKNDLDDRVAALRILIDRIRNAVNNEDPLGQTNYFTDGFYNINEFSIKVTQAGGKNPESVKKYIDIFLDNDDTNAEFISHLENLLVELPEKKVGDLFSNVKWEPCISRLKTQISSKYEEIYKQVTHFEDIIKKNNFLSTTVENQPNEYYLKPLKDNEKTWLLREASTKNGIYVINFNLTKDQQETKAIARRIAIIQNQNKLDQKKFIFTDKDGSEARCTPPSGWQQVTITPDDLEKEMDFELMNSIIVIFNKLLEDQIPKTVKFNKLNIHEFLPVPK